MGDAMQLRSFRYFIELANAGSFYAASKSLGISQQGLSRSMNALEDELGVILLERDRRGVRLSESGKIFLGYARQMCGVYDAMVDELCLVERAEGDADKLIKVYVSYYSAQIAAMDPEYVGYLSKDAYYIEEPYEKIMKRATTSDGSDLLYTDIYPYTKAKMAADPAIAFSPTLKTHYGILWKKGSQFEGKRHLACSAVARAPMAVNTFRETAQYLEWLFRDSPLRDVRMGATSPQMLIEYVRSSEDAVAVFDSFSYFLARRHKSETMADLGFTPFSTPDAVCEVGFVFPKSAKFTASAQYSIRLLAELLRKNCAEYFEEYPLD